MIPAWLQEKLATPPMAGTGIHAWLFSVARHLHAHMPAAAVAASLQAATTNAGRRVTSREIRDAVNNSLAVAWKPEPREGDAIRGGGGKRTAGGLAVTASAPDSITDRWPKPDAVARRCRIADAAAEGVACLADLWERSPALPQWTADDWLDWLFPETEWLCLAVDHPATARSRRREKWSFGPAEECGLVVPSPMTGPSGRGLDGRVSHRCLDNTGPRRWLVIEFDSGSVDEQAALHWHFRASCVAAGWPRLKLCVHSGGKSLHGWYGPCDDSSGDEGRARELMGYAASLGADTATFNRCQLVRLPGGVRKRADSIPENLPDGCEPAALMIRQEVFFFDPAFPPTTPCSTPLPTSSLAHGEPLDSTLRRGRMAA